MESQQWRVQVGPGTGLAIRTGSTLLVTRPVGEQQAIFVQTLQDHVEQASALDSEVPGRAVARKVSRLIAAAEERDVPPVGLLTATAEGLALLLVGDVHAVITRTDGTTEQVAGRDASTWVDRVLRHPLRSVTLQLDPVLQPDPSTDLRSGVVRAGGALLLPTPAPALASPPAPQDAPDVRVEQGATQPVEAVPAEVAATPAVPAASIPLDDPTRTQHRPAAQVAAEPATPPVESPAPAGSFVAVSLAEPLPMDELVPLPVQDSAAQPDVPSGPPVNQVAGICCARGHFNDPKGLYCATCGLGMVQQTHNLVPGIRPPLGVLVLDDGAVFIVDGDYVLGREPGHADDVLQGRALPLELIDPDQTMSRIHAKVHPEGWDVQVIDVGSANGTFVAEPGTEDWIRLVPDVPMTISPGTRLTIGGRSLLFDSYRRP